MPKKDTPPKHQTPNYRLVERTAKFTDPNGVVFTRTVSTKWEPTPLRKGRKDLQLKSE